MGVDPSRRGLANDVVGALRRAFLAALVAGDPVAAEAAIADAIDVGLRSQTIDDVIVAPAMRAIGRMWEDGQLSVAEEHLATEICYRVLALQREAVRTAARRPSATILLAAPEGEHHVLGLTMAGQLLTDGGYDVRMLGANVPTASLVGMVGRMSPEVLGLTATMPGPRARFTEIMEAVSVASPHTHLLLGGSAAPRLTPHSQSVTVCPMLAGVVEVIDAIVARAHLN